MESERRKFGMILAFAVLFATLAFVSVGCAASATTHYVPDNYAKIQWAVDNASVGDIIIVRDGTYTENIKVNKRLTIKSENGSTSTIVLAANWADPVFNITADYVKIIGFTVKGSAWGGISLLADYCNISNNNCSNNDDGIGLGYSNNSTISNNTCLNNGIGIGLGYSNNNTISKNTCISNYEVGIKLLYSYNNIIYLNNIINSRNVDSYESTNTWNSTLSITYTYKGTSYTNYLGNYWSDYGESKTEKDIYKGIRDTNMDGIGDIPYNIDSDKDNYPLIKRFENYVKGEEEEEKVPGFEAVFAIAGLLAVTYLLRKKK
ncbi:MAG: NosD domain-containing protein [Halobacteriota archaeon]